MSLHGLDDAVVTSAYQSALAEAGGWFLLKYVSREAVDVLDSGTRGAAEARAALVRYDEKSPLYGFLLYRRRKVLLKYTPEGTSRVLLARTAIHFNDVAAKFSPHDITMTINSPEEFSDAALASACSLHTAAPSSCSSSSSRKKLDEITESAEEPVDPDDIPLARLISKAASVKAASVSQPNLAEAADVEIPAPLKIRESPPRAAVRDSPKPESPLRRVQTAEEPRIRHSQETTRAILEQDPPFEPPTAEFRTSLEKYDDLFKGGPDPRSSSQTARPAIDELYAEMYAEINAKYNKPKVKLGPRPKVSLDGNRPNASGPGGRPVSTLPPGMRLANRKPPEPKRPKSRESSAVPSFAFPAPPPMPAFPMPPSTPTTPDVPPMSPMFPPRSPASVKSMTLPGHGHHGAKSSNVTQEKQRLMKALELRKKQMKARQQAEQKLAETVPVDEKPAETVAVDEKPVGKDVNTGLVLTVGDPEPIIGPPEEATAGAQHDDRASAKDDGAGSLLLPMPDLPISQESFLPEVRAPPETEEKSNGPQIVTVALTTRVGKPVHNEKKAPPSVEDSGIVMTHSLSENESSSPIVYTQASSRTTSTRPSSISDEDHSAAGHRIKDNTCDEATLRRLELPAESTLAENEKLSAASSPTVVPESRTPVVVAEITLQAVPQPKPLASAPAPEDPLISTNEEEPADAVPPSEWDDVHSLKRSKRESMTSPPSNASPPPDEAPSKRERRASLTLTVPKRRSHVENKENHGAMGDPIQIQLNGEGGSEDYLSDDSFMEELKSATVQEAKPISVSKSPITPFFPRKPSMSESERSTSGSRLGRLSPEQSSVRKISAGWPPPAMKRDDNSGTKKVSVSSGISQRIKALAEKSSKDSALSVSPLATPDASASTVAQRKSSFFSTLAVEDGKVLNRLSRSFAKLPSTTAPDKQPVLQFTPAREGPAVYNVKQTAKEPESVQVTARIVRDPRPLSPSLAMPNESTPLELQRSQITIDHQKSIDPGIKSPAKPISAKMEPTSPRPPSSSKDPISPHPRSSSESSWRTFGRRLSESKSVPPRSLSAHSSESTDDKREDKKEKKESRTSKMFKRMSSISSMSSRKSAKEDDAPSTLQPVREPPPAVQVGDLNVQFPDTLLWKRRWVEIDSAGNVVMSMSKNEQSKATTKRFHLREFRAPYAPDQDAQELPNSVAFDFLDGRTMQCACETYMAQAQVLQIFREAHDAWRAYDQRS